MVNPKVNEVVTTQDKFEEIYRNIGNYFINNAERLGKNAVDSTANVDVVIKLEPNSVVMIDISQSEVLRKQEMSIFPNKNVNVNEVVDKLVEKIDKKTEELKND